MLAEHQRKLQEEEQRRREEEERKERERKEREERKRKEREERERREREEKERVEREERERREREEKKREERERREREEREREAEERMEREERERRQREEVERKEKEESERKAYEQKERGGTLRQEDERRVEEITGPGKGKRDSIELLDSEISDVLFQFDKIVGALEKETDSLRATPTEFLTLSQVTMQADSTIQTGVDQSAENIRSENDQSNQSIECQAGQSHEVVNDLEEPMKAASKDEVEKDVGQAENRPEPLDTALSSKSPTERSSSEEQILSPKISVKELQQQFLLPSVPTKRTSISPEGELPASSVNVRTLIAQMQTTNPPPSPPPSPVSTRPRYESMNVIRRRPPSPTVHQRISALTQGFEDLGEKRQSKTYAPPPVRRRIQSPFLQSKKEKEGNIPVKGAMAKESTTSAKQNHVFNHVTAQSDRVPAQEDHMSAQDDHMIPLEDHVTVKNHVTAKDDHVTPKDEHVTPVEDHVTPREDHVTPREDHVTPVEDHVTPREDHVTPVEDHVAPVEDHVTPVEDHVTPVEDHVTPVEDHVTPVEDHVTSKDNVVIKEDDLTTKEEDATPNLTPKVDPVAYHMVPTEGQVTSNEGHMTIDERTSKSESSIIQMTNGSLPEVANVTLQPPREARTQNETAEVVTSENEFISTDVFSEQSSPPAANEGPLSLSPPIVVSPPPAHVVETTPPLTDEPRKKEISLTDLKPPETKDVRRQRSASESTKSTRVYAMGVPYRSAAVRSRECLQSQLSAENEERGTGDSVVRIECVHAVDADLHIKKCQMVEKLSVIDF